MLEGSHSGPRRLPFSFQASGGVGRLVLGGLAVGPFLIDRLELETSELGVAASAATPIERFQRRRTRLRTLAIRVTSAALDDRVDHVRKQLAAIGVTQMSARLSDGFVSVRARAADGLAAADLSFRIQLVSAGSHLRALASTVRVHGHLPTPGPVIADRILGALLGASEVARPGEQPRVRGLCDVEVDLIGALLWQLMPPSGWRLPAVVDVELIAIRTGRGAIEIAYGPAGTRSGELGVRPATHALAAAHDLMHSVDKQLREGHLEDAMRGFRALLAAGGPDQPLLLERILALAGARPAWFFDGLELARQALGRWPLFPPAHAALASITLAQGDSREAAGHLSQIAQLASADGDDDQAALAALAGARLLRVLDPRAATQLYQLALEHDPASTEAAESLADRLADEERWTELVRLIRARAVAAEPERAVPLRLRLADVFVRQLGDPLSAQQELEVARQLAPDDPAVHEMTAAILASSDPGAAVGAWREVVRLADARSDHRTSARAWATLGGLLAAGASPGAGITAEYAWRRALELDPLQPDALVGLAGTAAARGAHGEAVDLLERLRGLGLPQHAAARHELTLARSLVALERNDDARASLRRATLAGGETAAEAHAVLAEVAEATLDRDHAAAELDTAIESLVGLAGDDAGEGERLYPRAAQLAIARAELFDRHGQPAAASADYQRAHELAQLHAPELARDAARTLLARSGDDAGAERRWIDAVLATRPPPAERAALLVNRADVRRRERAPDLGAALADLHEALRLTEDESGPSVNDARRRAYQLEAELLAHSGDRRARAQALSALARMAERALERVEVEAAAAAAWLAADEPAAALPHGARAHAELDPDVPAPLRREVLNTLGEAAWRQRAWPDVIRAYRGLLDDAGADPARAGSYRHRLAVAADRSGDAQLAIATLQPLVADAEAARAIAIDLRGQVLRLYADLAERSGDLAAAATALETFASLDGDARSAADTSTTARADAMYRAGELFRRADRGDDAIRCLEAALRISDTHLPALDALETAWRERGDLERVSVILGRKVAATARHPARQRPLLSRLGELQAQLGRPDVALVTHQRALEIDPAWRPSLRYVSLGLRDSGQLIAAAGGLAQLAGELPGDHGVEPAIVARERQLAASALAELVAGLDEAQLDAVRDVARPALERAAADGVNVAGGLARVRGELPPRPARAATEENTQSGRVSSQAGAALSLRDAAERARAAGKLDEALATLETANHVSPGDPGVLRELVELSGALGDHEAAARHLVALADLAAGARRGDVLLELADVYYDRLDDGSLGRRTMRAAAEAFGGGARRDATLRLLATEASTHLAWEIAAEALLAIAIDRRTTADVVSLASALQRAGRDADAIASIEEATAAGRFNDGGVLRERMHVEAGRKSSLARSLDQRADSALRRDDAEAMRAEARELRDAIGEPHPEPGPHDRPTARSLPAAAAPAAVAAAAEDADEAAAGVSSVDDLDDAEAAAADERSVSPIELADRLADERALAHDGPDDRASWERFDDAALERGRYSSDRPRPAQLDTTQPDLAAAQHDDDAVTTERAWTARAPEAGRSHEAREGGGEADGAEAAADREAAAADREAADRKAADREAADREAADREAADREAAAAAAAAAADREAADREAADREAADREAADREAADREAADRETADHEAAAAGRETADRETAGASREAADRGIATAHSGAADSGTADSGTADSGTAAADRGIAARGTADRGSAAADRGSAAADRGSAAADRGSAAADRGSAATATDTSPSGPPSPAAPAIEAEPARTTELAHSIAGRTKTLPGTVAPELRAPAPDETRAGEPPSAIARIKLVSVAARNTRPGMPPPTAAGAPSHEDHDDGWVSASDEVAPGAAVPPRDTSPGEPIVRLSTPPDRPEPPVTPSVVISGSAAETALALAAAAASADRDQLIAAHRAQPDDPSLLLALLAHLGDREPALRRELLEDASRICGGRALAIALHELGVLAREAREPMRAATLWMRAYQVDPTYAPVWMPLADALAAADEIHAARELYERVGGSSDYDTGRRAFAADRSEALGRDDAVVSGEIESRVEADLARARTLAQAADWSGAIAAAERAAAGEPRNKHTLELLEQLYLEAGDVTAASEAIGRQLVVVEAATERAALWRRRARLYRDALGRDAEAYRCLKEAHACAPADPEISYQLRTAAMVRGEWALAASLLYREIAAASNPRDRGALHLELALIYEERLDDDAQAQVNYEQALAFDPTIPAAKLPLARRYHAIGRYAEAARLFEEAAATARAGDRASLLEAAARSRSAATQGEPDLAAQLDAAAAAGDLDAALDLAHQLWRAQPGHHAAFRLLANVHRASGDLAALSELTAVRASHAETPEERATAWLEVARLAEDVGALDQGARAYDLALIEDPGHLGALDARGALAFRLGDFATADLIYRDLGEGESVLGDDELALRRSIIAEQLGRDSEALAHARAAAAAAPGRRDVVMRVQELATRVGDLDTALDAARAVLELVPLDDDEAQLTTQFALVELLRQAGALDGAIAQLERILRDQPVHVAVIEQLAELHIARDDWSTAARYLYQLVPLAPTQIERAERLYRLGEAVLVHLGDTDRADDVFLRASDLDPTHVPTLRRLIDVYWRADDPGALVEVASELADKGALEGLTPESSLGHALVAAALVGDTQLAQRLSAALGDEAPRRVASALAELANREGRLQLATASTAITELARRGMLDLAKVRSAAAGTPVASVLAAT